LTADSQTALLDDPLYGPVPVDEKLMRERTNLLFFLWQYYANLEEGKTRLESFHNAKVEFAQLTESNQADLQAALGFELVIGLHYLGLADY
jgi:hypothetical protein